MTRLADITGLDRIGVPVWQAVRPWSRSVSVHQGKSLEPAIAELAACMEAIECHHAEHWAGETRVAAFSALPQGERLPSPDDCALTRGHVDPAPIAWTPVERIGSAGALLIPAASVCLDFSRPRPAWVDCGSNGQGAGFDLEFASRKALFELIERDAVAAWLNGGFVDRALDGVALTSIGFSWFHDLHERLRLLGIRLRIFAIPAVVPVPVILAELVDTGHESRGRPLAFGACADADAEAALRGALVEAAQSRLTDIAGARDDLDAHRADIATPDGAIPVLGLALPLPRAAALGEFDRLFADPAAPTASGAIDAVQAALADAGYPVLGRVELSPRGSPVRTVKMFAPGLGEGGRARRAPSR